MILRDQGRQVRVGPVTRVEPVELLQTLHVHPDVPPVRRRLLYPK